MAVGGQQMLLESFKEQLEMRREFVRVKLGVLNTEELGHEAAESFVVETSTWLCGKTMPPPSRVMRLPHIGEFAIENEKIEFRAAEVLKENTAAKKFLLSAHLKQFVGSDRSRFLGGRTWETCFKVSVENGDPFPGIECLSWLGTDILTALRKKDRGLKRVPFEKLEEAFIFYLHDSVVCDAGVELETVGTFRGDLTFEPDSILHDRLRALAHAQGPGVHRTKPLFIKVGPHPNESEKK